MTHPDISSAAIFHPFTIPFQGSNKNPQTGSSGAVLQENVSRERMQKRLLTSRGNSWTCGPAHHLRPPCSRTRSATVLARPPRKTQRGGIPAERRSVKVDLDLWISSTGHNRVDLMAFRVYRYINVLNRRHFNRNGINSKTRTAETA